jgi:hypothetical protein
MNTSPVVLQARDEMFGNEVRPFMSGLSHKITREQLPGEIDVEIENRLRNLERNRVMVEGVDCRSCFSKNEIGQVKIRMRLKQVTGLVFG